MFSYRNDPGTDGVGIAFSDAVAPASTQLNLALRDDPHDPGDDWRSVAERLGVRVFQARQCHSARVLSVDASSDPAVVAQEEADALVTTDPGIGVAVRAADCLPVLLCDAGSRVVAAAHAGRVGLAGGVLVATVARMRELGATRLRAWIGPHICGDCYEVPESLQRDYLRVLPAARCTTRWGTPGLDLGSAAAVQLADLGCEVQRVDPCTMTTGSLHSYRRDGAAAGRQAGIAWLS